MRHLKVFSSFSKYLYLYLVFTAFTTFTQLQLVTSSGNCRSLNSVNVANRQFTAETCANVLDYSVQQDDNQCISSTIHQPALQVLPYVTSVLSSSSCRVAVAILVCTSSFSRCGYGNVTLVQSSLCNNVFQACTDSGDLAILNQLLAVTGFPLSCNNSLVYSNDPSPLVSKSGPTVIPADIPSPTCQLYTGKVCANVISGPVYIPSGGSLEDLENSISLPSTLWALAPYSTGCLMSHAIMTCSTSLVSCAQVSIQSISPSLPNRYISLPRLPCRDQCIRYNSTCNSLIQALPAMPSNICTSTGKWSILNQVKCNDTSVIVSPGLPDYPVSSSVFSNIFPQLTTTCQDFGGVNSLSQNIKPNVQCPLPLVIPDTPSTATRLADTQCATPCPGFIFSDAQLTMADRLFAICASLSFIATTFMMLTWLVFPRKRNQTLILCFLICLFFVALLIVIHLGRKSPSQSHYASLGCKSNSELILVPSDGPGAAWCTFFATAETFLTIATVIWWTFTAFDLWLKVVLNYHRSPNSKEHKMKLIFYHAYAWGFGLACAFAALGTQTVTGGTDLAWCTPSWSDDYPRADWGTFYYPILVHLAIGTFLMTHTCIILGISARRARSTDTWKRHIRPIIFIISFLTILGFICAYRINGWFQGNAWQDVIVNYLTCLLTEQVPLRVVFGVPTYDPCGKLANDYSPIGGPSLTPWLLIHVAISCQGIIMFLVYGTLPDNYALWTRLFADKLGWKCCKRLSDALSRTDTGGAGSTINEQGTRTHKERETSTSPNHRDHASSHTGGMNRTRITSQGGAAAKGLHSPSHKGIVSPGSIRKSSNEGVPVKPNDKGESSPDGTTNIMNSNDGISLVQVQLQESVQSTGDDPNKEKKKKYDLMLFVLLLLFSRESQIVSMFV